MIRNKIIKILIAMSFGLFGLGTKSYAKVVKYELTASKGTVNLSGKAEVDWALMINGGIPAPTLEFTEGDEAEIIVHNQLTEEVSIHWHGLLLPPEMDGVPYVNTPPILAGESFTFRFVIRQHGTYWYHSHTKLQEQKGIYGAIVIHPRERKITYDKDVVVVLSDWSDENADNIMKNLRKDGDYYLYKKKSMRSWFGAVRAGALDTLISNEWTRMGGMDLSDVGYDAFLANGKRSSQIYEGKPGDKVRIRIINAAASSYFYVALGQRPMQVIAADGVDIKPVFANELLIAMAETYDVLFEIPKNKNTELRATSQDVTGFASGWIGAGDRVSAPDKTMPDMYAAMDHGNMNYHGMAHGQMNHAGDDSKPGEAVLDHGKMDHGKMDHGKMDHGKMDHVDIKNTLASSAEIVQHLTVDHLKSLTPTVFPESKPVYDLKLILGGDMERYVWHINGKAIHEDHTIEINEGDVVRFTFVNQTMMHHPMHLHGHFFRVLNANGDFSPLKHTVDVPPHGTRTIEFLANEPGQWMLHCHNLYHMKTGMARIIKYKSFTPSVAMSQHAKNDPHLHDHIYFNGSVTAATNQAKAEFTLSKTWDTLELHAESREYDSTSHVSADLLYHRWFTNFFNVISGASYFAAFEENKTRGVVGFGYTLPMLIETNLLVDHTGNLRLDLGKHFQWTSYVFSDFEAILRQRSTPEVSFSLMYGPSWSWAAGFILNEDNIGGGLRFRF